MKFLHTADLHIGKVVNEFSMLEEQKHTLKQILDYGIEKQVDAIVIAGDIYDRSVPPADAVKVFDEFITQVSQENIALFIISGNHDSPERLSFAKSILEKRGVYIEGNFEGKIKCITLKDEYGNVNFYLLPFVRPMTVKAYLEEEIHNQNEAIKALVSNTPVDENERNVMVTHFFVTNSGREPQRCDSETLASVGDVENVDVTVFEKFDYVALGHIHGAQKIGDKEVYYSGSPIKYSFSEVNHIKGVNLVEIKEKGQIDVKQLPLTPLHDMRCIKGEIAQLLKKEIYSLEDTNDYICATLTDKDDIYDAMGKIRSIYPNAMKIIIEKNEMDKRKENIGANGIKNKSPLELYKDFYEMVTGEELENEKEEIMKDVIEKASEEVK